MHCKNLLKLWRGQQDRLFDVWFDLPHIPTESHKNRNGFRLNLDLSDRRDLGHLLAGSDGAPCRHGYH